MKNMYTIQKNKTYFKAFFLPLFFLFFLCSFSPSVFAQEPIVEHEWAKRLGGGGSDFSYDIILDSSGNIYITGSITGNADLNGDGDFTDPYESGTGFSLGDAFFSVFTSEGSHLWAKRLGGIGDDFSLGINLDSSGNIYTTGQITGNADLNGDGDFTDPYESGTGFESSDAFISVFTSEGSPLWSKRFGGTSGDGVRDIILDSLGNVYITGNIIGDVDLNSDGDFTDPYESGVGFGVQDAFISVFSFDPAPPTIPLNSLSLSDNTKITGITKDNISSLSSVEYRLSQEEDFTSCQASDEEFNSKEESFICILPPNLPEGSYTAWIRATDSRNNTSEEVSFPFIIQFPPQTPPQNENQSQPESQPQTPSLQKHTWTTDTQDSLSFSTPNYLNKKDPTLQGKNESSKNGTITLYKKTKKGGTQKVATYPIDEKGNWDIDLKHKDEKKESYALSFTNQEGLSSDISSFFTLAVDTDKPHFVESLPQTTTKDPQEPLSFLAGDKTTEITHYQVQLYDQQGKVVRKWRKQNDPFYFLPESLPLGIYTLHIRAYDKAGNKQESQVTIDFSKKEGEQEQENQENQGIQETQGIPQTNQEIQTLQEQQTLQENQEQQENQQNEQQNEEENKNEQQNEQNTPQTFQPQGRESSSNNLSPSSPSPSTTPSTSSCMFRWYNPLSWGC